MHWLNRLERKFGRYAVSGLTRYMIFTYVIGYVLSLYSMVIKADVFGFINFNPYLILHGQIWRLFSWIFVPPGALSLWTVIMLLFYYQIGMALEQTWGEFRYNLYIFSGLLITMAGCLIMYFVGPLIFPPVGIGGGELWGRTIAEGVTTYYVNMTIFFAFAASYPNMEVRLYFLIPVKIKWLAIFDGVLMLYSMIVGSWHERFIILFSFLNFIIFFLSTRNYKRLSPHEIHRKWEFKRSVNRAGSMKYNTNGKITKHKCAICGRTELDSPTLEFRFCSRCNGNYEYCQDHLFTHKHIS